MTNITKEAADMMQARVDELAKKSNHIPVGGFNKKGRPDLEKEQTTLYEKWYGGKTVVKIKPLSNNDSWTGRRFRSDKYKKYEKELMHILPDMKIPKPPYKVTYEFGFSSKGSDIDNPCKNFGDVLQKRYDFNDNQVYEMIIYKKIVKKGQEYISFKIESL